ncbi:hypothetical protein SEA_MOSSY_15 [Gordonia phage Mossy]|nr:hypothetical protein SEA_MOSSY_15 [Gordonia phage Mossy]
MASMDVQDFLEHHGVKGMKWGVTRDNPQGVKPTAKMVREVSKETRKEHQQVARAAWNEKSTGQKVGTVVLDLATAGAYTTSKMAKAEGYSRGKRTALTLMGGYGAMHITEAKLQRDVEIKLGAQR